MCRSDFAFVGFSTVVNRHVSSRIAFSSTDVAAANVNLILAGFFVRFRFLK